VRKYKIEYAADTRRLGEYAADARNNSPRKKAYLSMDRTCCGMKIVCEEAKRRIALTAIKAIQPT
jgi:hypothetical protein